LHPACRFGDVEAHELVVLLDQLRRRLAVAELRRQVADLIVEDIRQPLQEDQGQDVVLELRGVERPPNLTGSIPKPAFQGWQVELLCGRLSRCFRHERRSSFQGKMLHAGRAQVARPMWMLTLNNNLPTMSSGVRKRGTLMRFGEKVRSLR